MIEGGVWAGLEGFSEGSMGLEVPALLRLPKGMAGLDTPDLLRSGKQDTGLGRKSDSATGAF